MRLCFNIEFLNLWNIDLQPICSSFIFWGSEAVQLFKLLNFFDPTRTFIFEAPALDFSFLLLKYILSKLQCNFWSFCLSSLKYRLSKYFITLQTPPFCHRPFFNFQLSEIWGSLYVPTKSPCLTWSILKTFYFQSYAILVLFILY